MTTNYYTWGICHRKQFVNKRIMMNKYSEHQWTHNTTEHRTYIHKLPEICQLFLLLRNLIRHKHIFVLIDDIISVIPRRINYSHSVHRSRTLSVENCEHTSIFCKCMRALDFLYGLRNKMMASDKVFELYLPFHLKTFCLFRLL